MAGIGSVFSIFTGFRGRLLFLAGILVLGGYFLNFSGLLDSDNRERSQNGPSLSSNWVGSSGSASKGGVTDSWGDAAIQIGLSFGISMIFASMLRAFLKSMVSFLIVAGLVCWFLHSKGLIDPFWENIDISAASVGDWSKAQFESAKGFVGGILPSTGAAIAGFLFGLRR